MSENNELHWCVNTESQNFYSAFFFCLLLQKCPLSLVEKSWILEKKARLVLLMPSFSLSQRIIWKTEEWQSFTAVGEGDKN